MCTLEALPNTRNGYAHAIALLVNMWTLNDLYLEKNKKIKTNKTSMRLELGSAEPQAEALSYALSSADIEADVCVKQNNNTSGVVIETLDAR